MRDLHIPLREHQLHELDEFAGRSGYPNAEAFVAAFVHNVLAAPRHPYDARVIAGVLEGKCDADIAADLNVTNNVVSDIRRRYKMKPNRRYGAESKAAR